MHHLIPRVTPFRERLLGAILEGYHPPLPLPLHWGNTRAARTWRDRKLVLTELAIVADEQACASAQESFRGDLAPADYAAALAALIDEGWLTAITGDLYRINLLRPLP